MADLTELYQNVILDHNRRPRNFHPLEGEGVRKAEGYNPLCGDQLTVWLKLDGERIDQASFQGSGCAISKASASLMTTAVRGRTRAETVEMFERFHRLVTGRLGPEERETLGKLAVFAGVAEFPIRVKCASLPWHALKAALEGAAAEAVSTE
ncbi:MAG TPA: SUF system NifU family Fe-S cluster assembly protein [Gemmatimonadales bacterium]|nr:SUF system NifU family Fe-S cluster assembly protein [Gemmatimonadales bacterium]